MSRKNKIILLILSVLLAGIAASVVVVLKKRKKEIPKSMFSEGMKLVNEGQHERALKFLTKALEELPDNRQIIWELAKVHSYLQNSSKAQQFAIKVWNKGKKDRESLFLLLDNSGFNDRKLKIEYALRLAKEIKDEALKTEIYGDLKVAEEDFEGALELYKQASVLSPGAELIYKQAVTLINYHDEKGAAAVLTKAAEQGALDERGYILLLSLKFELNETENLDDFFRKVEEQQLDGCDFLYKKAFIFMTRGKYQDGLAVLSKSLKKDELTEEQGRKARMLAAYIVLTSGESEIPPEFKRSGGSDSPQAEAEDIYLSLIQEIHEEDRDLNEVSVQIQKSLKLLPESFMIRLFNAKVESMKGNHNEAINFYANEKEALHRTWSRFIINHAQTLQKAGKFRRSVKLLAGFHVLNNGGTLESLILIRNLYSSLKDFDRAERIQKFLLDAYPDNRQITLEGGFLAVDKKDYEKALEVFKGLKERSAGTFKMKVQKAILKTYLDAKKPSKAYETASALQSESPDYLLFKGQAAVAMNNDKEAEKSFREYVKQKPCSESSHALAFFLLRRNRVQEAETIFRESQGKYKKGWTYTGLASVKIKKGAFSEAERLIIEALKDPEENMNASLLQAEIDFQKRKFSEALTKLGLLEIFYGGVPRLYELKAFCYFSLNDFINAIPNMKTSYEGRSSFKKLIFLAQCHFNLKEFPQAEQLSEKVINSGVGLGPAASLFVQSCVSLRKYKYARERLQALKERLGRERFIQLNSIITVSADGPETALKELEPDLNLKSIALLWVYIKASHGGEFRDRAKAMQLSTSEWLNIGNRCLARNDFKNAAFFYGKATEKREDAFILNNYAWCLYKSGEAETALAAIAKAYKLEPEDDRIIDTYSRVLIAAGKYQECIDLVKPRVLSGDNKPEFLLAMAVSFEKLKNMKSAVYFYEKLLKKMDDQKWNLEIPKSQVEKTVKENSKFEIK